MAGCRGRFLVGFLAYLALCNGSYAQTDFPTRPVVFVIPWGPGGSNDIIARTLQPLLKEQGITTIIENVPGANGSVGMRRVASASPDGYTIGMNSSSTLAMIAQGKAALKTSQFANIARVSIEDPMLIVRSDGPYKNLEQFLQHMKDNPGKVTIASPGIGNVNHIFASMTARAAGVDYVMVPYTGGAQIMTDLSGGQIDATVLKAIESIGQIQANVVKPIGIFANERVSNFPDVPTFKEKGIDVFPFGPVVQMAYVDAPAGLPPAVLDRLISAFRIALKDPRYQEFARKNAFRIDDMTGEALSHEVTRVGDSIATVSKEIFNEQK
jgi:tripartite-type tricarboxylate transporter receptor subunit TctC